AVGSEAKLMLGRTPDEISAIRPLKDGVIADFEVTGDLLREFVHRVQKHKCLVRPRIIICVPSGITEVEKRAVIDSAVRAGAREVLLVPEPIAAAIGVGLPVDTPTGNMVVDIGGGTTEIAVIALNGIVTKMSIRVGGDEMDEAIANYAKKAYNMLIGEQTAERIKIEIGSAFPLTEEMDMEIKGRDLVRGIPRTLRVSSVEIREALQEPIGSIVNALRESLERTPPELAADIVHRGIFMTGAAPLPPGPGLRRRAPPGGVVLIGDRIASSWRENQHLRQRVTELELENVKLRDAAVENQQLREELQLPLWHGLPLKPVEILALSGEPIPVSALLSAG